MAYHTIIYLLVFLPAALITYQIVPAKHRPKVLLAYSYAFFFIISKKLLICLLGTTLFTHYIGIWLGYLKLRNLQEGESAERSERKNIKNKYRRKERGVLLLGILVLLAVLIYLKYYNFLAFNINQVIGSSSSFSIALKPLLLPIGISFYTLQAIGYMADVYWERIPAERNLGRLALFLGFFPHIMEGPIGRYKDITRELQSGAPLRSQNLSDGAIRIFWGLFKKMIIADRLFVIVKQVFNNYQAYSGAIVVFSAIAYTVQLYMEFSGSIDVVIGSGKMFGVCLAENFRQPFFSKNASEFWRRWHITLGAWFKDYIFYPISTSTLVKKWNKFGKKHLGKYITRVGTSAIALFPVWLCNGIWHGASWNFIFYGMYYFVIILFGIIVEPLRSRVIKALHIKEHTWYFKTIQIAKTWVIIFTGELFFRANGLRAGIHMFRSIFQNFQLKQLWGDSILQLGLSRADYLAIICGIFVVAIFSTLKEKNIDVQKKISHSWLPMRWGIYYALIFAVIIFGAYGDGYRPVDLIYAGF